MRGFILDLDAVDISFCLLLVVLVSPLAEWKE